MNFTKAIGMLAALASASALAQASLVTDAIQCQLTVQGAKQALDGLPVIEDWEQGDEYGSDYNAKSVRAFGFDVTGLSFIDSESGGVHEHIVQAIIPADYSKLKAAMLRSVGGSCSWEETEAGKGNCSVSRGADYSGKLSVIESFFEPGTSVVYCTYSE